MIWGANLRGFGGSEADSIGCGNGLLPVLEPEIDVIDGDGEGVSRDVLSLVALRECLIFVSTGWGKARRCFVALRGRSPEGGCFIVVDLLLSSIGCGKGKGLGFGGEECGGMIIAWEHTLPERCMFDDYLYYAGDNGGC